jgi:hypothetical protein
VADDGDELIFYPLNGLTLGDVFANARGSNDVPFCISQEGVVPGNESFFALIWSVLGWCSEGESCLPRLHEKPVLTCC